MLVIKNSELNSPHIHNALSKIEHCSEFSGKTGFRVAKFVEVIRREMRKTQSTYLELLKTHCELNENGEPKMDTTSIPPVPAFKEGQKEKYDEAFQALMNSTFDVKVHKVPLEEIEKAKLTPVELVLLEGFIDVPEDDEDAVPNAPGLVGGM